MGSEVVAYIALAAFPLFALIAFRKYSTALATSIVVLCGSVLLPERISYDFPAVPPLDKEYVTFLSLFLAAAIQSPSVLRAAQPGRGLEAIVLLAFLSILGTAAMNLQPFFDEGRLEPALGLYWIIANTGDDLLTLALPFFLGRALIRTPRDLATLVGAMAVAGALYVVPIFVEVLLSLPFRVFQLSQILYGVPMRPQFRWGFTQPIVFMDNGLSLATFMASGVISANGFLRARMRIFGWRARWIRNVLLVGLVMTFNVAGTLYGLALTAAFMVLPLRRVGSVAVLLASFALVYPALRVFNLFPYEEIVSFASGFDAERARSLEGRFLEEEHVLGGIGSRLWFGWGNIARVPGAETFGTGEQGLDGWWTIQLGVRGLAGWAIYFFTLGIPVLLTARRLRFVRSSAELALLVALMAIVGMRMVDLIINGWWNDLPIFLAGALFGLHQASMRGEVNAPTVGTGTRSRAPTRTSPWQRRRPAPPAGDEDRSDRTVD